MTCGRCKHEFCWLCMAPYKGPKGVRTIGNIAHKKTCAYHPARLPTMRAGNVRSDYEGEGGHGRLFDMGDEDDLEDFIEDGFE